MKPIDPRSEIIKIIDFIQTTFKTAGKQCAVLGVSGGIDSATSLALAVRALGKESVFPILMPYGSLSDQGVTDAQQVISSLSLPSSNVQTINIQPMVDAINLYDSSIDDLRKGNIMARVRMIILFDQAKKRNALVVGTENKTEHYLGYYTRFGDEASDIEPLRSLYKTQVYELARELGVPESVRTKAPTAGLWDGQTDEVDFGFIYKDADEILYLHGDLKKTKEEIVATGKDMAIVEKILSYAEKNNYKQNLPKIYK